jgi:mRNA interferase MazF
MAAATTARFAFGDVLLVPFPFTNQAGAKQRPTVVVSSNTYNAQRPDLVIMAITSQIRQPLAQGEALLADWQGAGLIKASVLKPVLTTIEQRLVIRGGRPAPSVVKFSARDCRALTAAELDRNSRLDSIGSRGCFKPD